jgi:DNA-binding CsgD family transcriptional regulator
VTGEVAGLPLWIEAISAWCGAIRGEISLEAAMAELLSAAGAEAGMIVRSRHSDGHRQRIAVYDRRAGSPWPLHGSFGQQIFGHHLNYARRATVWVQSAHDPVAPEALADFQAARSLRDFAVLVLSSGPTERDDIELHFRQVVEPARLAALATALGVLSRNWAGRKTGLAQKSINDPRIAHLRPKAKPADILDVANPARLSRAEFRVCLQLSRGLSVRGVCESLNLTEATVRSHLRNIYAKSETASLAELVYLLMDGRRQATSAPIHRSA